MKFNGGSSDDYNLWRVRAEIALKSKLYWSILNEEDYKQEIKDNASAIILGALGDSAFRVAVQKFMSRSKCLNYLI